MSACRTRHPNVVAAAVSVDPRTRLRTEPSPTGRIRYEPRGAPRDLFFHTDPEVIIEGPAGTGKSLACLKKLDRNAIKYPGSRQLILRKTRVSLTQTGMVTFEKHVVVPGGRVRFHTTLQAYLYPNGSIVAVGGLDKDTKIMSSEWDTIFVQEANELSESEWENLTTRLRHGVMPYQQMLGDLNPNAPTHWINQRCNAGRTVRLVSRHEHNPALWDSGRNAWTALGTAYIAKLDALTGVRYQRLRLGKWVAAEGQVFDAWNRDVHVVNRDDLPALGLSNPTRYVAGVDWGYTKPGSILTHAVGGDGQMCLVDEVYMTRKTNDWWIAQAQRVQQTYNVETFVCDPSEPAYIEAFIQAGLRAVPATNAILPGITAVQERLAIQADGRARYYVLADANKQFDPALLDAKLPTGFLDEIDAYVWPQTAGRKERPVDDNNHAMDATRYVVMHVDGGGTGFEAIDTEMAAQLMAAGLAGIGSY